MELLKQLYSINSKSGHEAQVKRLVLAQLTALQLDIKEDSFGNIFITKGRAEAYPCLAAHLDEVHFPSERNIIDHDGVICAVDGTGQRVGIGADDKNGLWMIVRLLHEIETLKVALFVQEEKDGEMSGCRGSNACDLDFFNDCKYIIECDRKGNSDLVVYSEKAQTRLCDDDFFPSEILEEYGYQPVLGGKTDVTALRMRGLGIPCCNVSCGYYNAHHSDEYTVTADLLHALGFVKEILNFL